MPLIPHFVATATTPTGSINLAPYPGLTYAPYQHGEGIRFALNGRSVDEVAASERARAASVHLDAIAAALGVSFGDSCDALKYLRDQNLI